MGRLSAEFTVFRASSASAVDNAAKVNVISAEGFFYRISPFAELFKAGSDEKGLVLTVGQPFSRDDLFCKFYHIHINSSFKQNVHSYALSQAEVSFRGLL